jgi:hypothetical protein
VRQLQRVLAVSAVLVIGSLGVQGLAGAQPYQGTVVASNGTQTVVAQVVTIGTSATWTATACGFAYPGTATFTIAGTADGTASVDSEGCAVLNGTTQGEPHMSINGGALVAVPYGNATVVVSGLNPSGGANTDTIIVPIVAPSASSTAAPLAFTGADIAAIVVGGLALVSLGFLVLTFTRRRRRATS